MAGMDYEQLSFDNTGKRVDTIYFDNGFGIQPYKSCLYLEHEKIWDTNISHFSKPIIAQMTDGYLEIAYINIIASRYGSNKSRMVWLANKIISDEKSTFCGICTYGHINTDAYYVQKAGYNYKGDWCTETVGKQMKLCSFDGKIKIPIKKEIESWVGITQYDLEKLYKFLKENCHSELAKNIKKNIPNNLPEIDIKSFLEDTNSLYNTFWGKKPFPKFDYRKYL